MLALFLVLGASPMCTAGDLDSIPLGEFGVYDRALSAARRAVLIQTGIESGYEQYKGAVTSKATMLIESSITQYPLAITLLMLRIYRENAVTLMLTQNKRLTLRPDRFELKLDL